MNEEQCDVLLLHITSAVLAWMANLLLYDYVFEHLNYLPSQLPESKYYKKVNLSYP